MGFPEPNTFHEALQVGDCVAARKMLEQMKCSHHKLHLELSDIDCYGRNACRFVVERRDEQMFDVLLPFLLPEHFVERSKLDGLSAIQRAVQLNPEWYSKFNVPFMNDAPFIPLKVESEEESEEEREEEREAERKQREAERKHREAEREAREEWEEERRERVSMLKRETSPETVYLMMLDLEDMDNGEKYEALWKDFLQQDAEALSTFILKCLKRDFRKLAWKMLRARTSSINRKCLVELLKAAMECDFPDFFIDALEVLPKGVSIVCEILESGKKRYLDIFLDMKREFTLFDSINIVGSDSISKNTLSDIMDRGLPLFSDNRGLIPRFPGFDKFCLLLQAGFFPNEEKLFLQRAPGSVFVRFGRPDIVLDDDDVPTLQTLAVNQIRQALICSQKKSMQFVCKSLLGDVQIPQIFKPLLVQPYTKAQMQLIMFVRAGPWRAC